MMARYDKTTISLVIALVVLLVGNFLVADWVRFIALQSLSRGLVALGLMVMWRAGLISFGHALYFGIGAYATAYLSHFEGITDAFVLLFASMVAGGGVAYGLGFLLRRYRDIFFALLNMAFSMILYGMLVKTDADTLGSSDGLGVPPPTFLGYAPEGEATHIALFALASVLCCVIGIAVHRYLSSTLGSMTTAIKENEIRVEYLGYSVHFAIHVKYVMSGILAGLGGGLMALTVGQVDPDSMAYWLVSGAFVFITILAGPGSVAAPFLGAAVFELIRTYAFEYAPQIWQLILGGTLLAIIMFLPNGLWSLLGRLRRQKA